jgi:hypothetical protein
MIGKISKGRSFSGLLAYLFKEKELEQPGRGNEQEQQKGKEQELEQALNGRENVEKDDAGPEQAERDREAQGKEQQREGPANDREGESRGKIIATNMAGRNANELWHEFDAIASLNPEVECKVFHCALGIPKEDQISPEQKIQIIEKFVKEAGFENTMWVAVEHDEHAHKEIHFAASRVDYDGKTISDSRDYEHVEEIMRRTEKEFGLRQVEPSREAMRRCSTQQEMKYYERTGVLSTRIRLQEHVDAGIGHGATATELIERLEERGVQVVPFLNDAGQVKGISFRLDGKQMKGSNLGRGYSWQGLQKDWPKHRELRQGKVTHEHTRDDAAIGRAGGREAAYQHESESRKRGTDGREIRGNTEAIERDSKTAGSHREKSHLTATGRGGVHQKGVPVSRGGGQEMRNGRAEVDRAGRVGGQVRSSHGQELASHGRDSGEAEDGLRGHQSTLSGHGLEGPARQISRDTRGLGENVGSRESVPGGGGRMPGTGNAMQPRLRDEQQDDRGVGRNVQEAPDRGEKQISGGDRRFEQEVRPDVPQTNHDGRGHPVMSVLTVLFMIIILSIGATLLANLTLTERAVRKSVEASTEVTQETLKPMMEKIEEQPRSLDTVYQQSQAFDYFIETLPAKDRRNKRDELMAGMRRQKLKEAENTQRQTE